MQVDLYNKKKACKFILAKIENGNSNEQLETQTLTIEHILPQQKNSVVWKKEIGEAYFDVYNKYLHTIGNLTITGYNSDLGTKPFYEKKSIIQKNSKANVLNKEILDRCSWDESSIIRRAEVLADLTIKIFDIKESIIIETEEIDENRRTIADVDDVVGTKPISYYLCGETGSVNSYAEMLRAVIKTLYYLEPLFMEKLAEAGTIAYISRDKALMRRPNQIELSGIYFELNLSAKSILHFIKDLLEIYSMEEEEFYFIINGK